MMTRKKVIEKYERIRKAGYESVSIHEVLTDLRNYPERNKQ